MPSSEDEHFTLGFLGGDYLGHKHIQGVEETMTVSVCIYASTQSDGDVHKEPNKNPNVPPFMTSLVLEAGANKGCSRHVVASWNRAYS